MKKSVFNEEAYLAANPDVAAAVKSGTVTSGWHHYTAHGKSEGRILGEPGALGRVEKVLSGLRLDGLGMEIGPSHRPIAPKREGFNVHVVDHLDKQGLVNKYQGHEQYGVDLSQIEDVDFVWQGQPLAELVGQKECYDWIIASHVVEHVPDLITFFQQCETLLKPDGRLSLVVPDKRYCFDYYRQLTSTGELLDAYYQKRIRPTPGQIFDHFSCAAKKGGYIAWTKKTNGDFELIHDANQARSLWNKSTVDPEYIDAHCWKFVPESFRLICEDLNFLGLSALQVISFYDTVGSEFFVQVRKTTAPADGETYDRRSRLKEIVS